MNRLCGCCTGIEVLTPETEVNRPGLSAIAYRAGTFTTFYESMVARLSALYLDVPSPDSSGAMQRIYPLRKLTTREPSDFSIALLDAWSTVADVLTFYQERIANEGFLGTATERLSVLELAKLIGYRLRPGVSASVFLAFTASDGFKGTIPAGTRAQSIPGTGEKPQFFETSVDLDSRDVWNNLGVRLTRPQAITLVSNPLTRNPATIDQGTDAATRDTLYFQGISTNLKAGDMLLIVSGSSAGQQVMRIVQSVSPQATENRTEVTLQQPLIIAVNTQDLPKVLTRYIEDSSNIFGGSTLAAQVASILSSLLEQAKDPASDLVALLQAAIEQVTEKHEIAVKRDFTRLEPWISDLLNALNGMVIASKDREGSTGSAAPLPGIVAAPRGLSNLAAIVEQLALPPNPQPANSLRLGRSVAQTFLAQSDIAPRLLSAFNPLAATTLYDAWEAIPPTPTPIQVFAMRSKGSAFGNNAPKQIVLQYSTDTSGGVASGQKITPNPTEWNLSPTDLNNPATFSMDSLNDKIMPGDWAVVTRTDANAAGNSPVIAQVVSTQSASRADYGMSARITQLALSKQWLVNPPTPAGTQTADISILRGATLYAQPEELPLAEEPLDRDVEGDNIELDGLYAGLEPGRWVIVSGKRTDVTDSTGATSSTGVNGTELAMIAGVNQGPGKQSCAALTVGSVPFGSVFYVTDQDEAGDRLVVGSPNAALLPLLANLPPPNTADNNQQICDPVELAPGLYANIYLPTKAERAGSFKDFVGMLVDPYNNNVELPGGQIPPSRMKGQHALWAWRITSIANSGDTPHTNLVLANSLAYSYDSASVTLYGNVVKATHGQTVGEVLGDGDSSQSLQKFTLGQSPLTYVASPTPAGAASTLSVRVNEIEWHEADDLASLGPTDRDYVTDTDDAATTSVVFGTGEHGRRPPTGISNVKATYRYGIGKGGNVTAQKISQLASQPLGVKGVINPLQASGGADADNRDQARRNAPLAVGALDRLVSVEDYALFARSFAGIGKASSVRLSDGRRLTVHLTIAGTDDIPIDVNSDLYQNLVLALQQNGDPHQPVQVALRRLKLLVMSAAVKLLPDYAWESVEPAIRDVLLNTFGFDERDLGQSAFLSEAISAVQNVEGVNYVNVTTFDSVAEDITAEELAALASTLKLQRVVQANLAQVNSAQADPDNRILPAEVAILKPDISDTLILTQITG